MSATNNAMLIRRELLSIITKKIDEGNLVETIDRVPIEIRPKETSEISRCCKYKDRAMLKYRLMALLGYSIQDETDELTPLSKYAQDALDRKTISDTPLTVIDEACSACVKANYFVTNMCRGCVARTCIMNCPKEAIIFVDGHAQITTNKCISCGICQDNCPFHAIIFTPVPCEEACPVGAITKDEKGIEHIDDSKCIYCGRCISACPFGAMMEKSHVVDVMAAIKDPKRKIVAMVAPAIIGQFKQPLGRMLNTIRKIGFDDVIEVALGANTTTANESAEFMERIEAGAPYMTTSCCTSYTQLITKHLPFMELYVSHTKTPAYYTAEIARKMYPDADLVFIGPCLSKKKEAILNDNIQYMLSFEEIGSMMVGLGLFIGKIDEEALNPEIEDSSRAYAISNGVMKAVGAKLPAGYPIKPLVISGINKASIKQLKMFEKKLPEANMIEIMSCEGGCVNGCNVLAKARVAARQVIEVSNYKE